MPVEIKTKAVFETATLADALKKASRVAPGKGAAFDKAAGIVIDLAPGSPVVVSATNLELFQKEWITAIEIDGEITRWRVPSDIMTKVISSLPLGSGQSVTITEQREVGSQFYHLLIRSNKTRARVNLMEHSYYPDWTVFDPSELLEVKDLGAKVRQVEWAADKSTTLINCLRITPTHLICTDKYRLATAEMSIPGVEDSFSVSAGILGDVLSKAGEVRIGFSDNQMLMMTDDYTQVRCVLVDGGYPNVQRVMREDWPCEVQFQRQPVIEMIGRALTFAAGDRFPALTVYLGKNELAVHVSNREIGHLGDVLDLPGQADHARVVMVFTPDNLVNALSNSPNDKITFKYDPAKPDGATLVDGGSGYKTWVMARRDTTREVATEG